MKRLARIHAVLLVSMLPACSTAPPVDSVVSNNENCRYEITVENYRQKRSDCQGFVRQENYERIMKSLNHDALVEAQSLEVSYEDVVIAALKNKQHESYCLTIFGQAPSEKIIEEIRSEDELIDCSEKHISTVSVTDVTLSPDGRFRVGVVFDCGLTGRCRSAWEVFIEKDKTGQLRVVKKELDWIT